MKICGKHNPALVLPVRQTQTGRRWRSADGGGRSNVSGRGSQSSMVSYVPPGRKWALSGNRFGDKSLGFHWTWWRWEYKWWGQIRAEP